MHAMNVMYAMEGMYARRTHSMAERDERDERDEREGSKPRGLHYDTSDGHAMNAMNAPAKKVTRWGERDERDDERELERRC